MVAIFAISFGVFPLFAGAQTSGTAVICTNLIHPLSYGSTDASTVGDVSALQAFLSTEGYFSVPVIGIFGPVTRGAVERFQSDNGIPAIGIVGPLTRAKVRAISCGTNPPPQSSVSIYSITPSSGPVGTTVTLGGNGFTADNIIHFGGGAIAHVAAAPAVFNCPMQPAGSTGGCGAYSQTLTFVVPQSVGPYCAPGTACPMYVQLITPGTYNVSVQNSNGTSNTVTFTVTSTTSGNPLSVTGLDAPASLALGASGTWTVHATGSGQLHYAVTWGDEMIVPTIQATGATSFQTSATFTHVYNQSGTYTPTFTVSDDSGHTTTASARVTVTPLY